MNKKPHNIYDRVMSRVYNGSRSSLKSNSVVKRHEIPSSVRVGAKPSDSNISSSVFSELPTVLNDYVPEVCEKNVESVARRSNVVKPRRTLKSLDTSKSPPRTVVKSKVRPHMRTLGSSQALPREDGWSSSHLRQCHSSRSHTKLKDLRDEIKAYHETDKLLRLRSNLYKKCGIVFDDYGDATDKAVQAEVEEKEPDEIRYVVI